MTAPRKPISPRLLAALGVREADLVHRDDGAVEALVDSVDRRFRDAIKAGARPLGAPVDDPGVGRCARVRDEPGGTVVVLLAMPGR